MSLKVPFFLVQKTTKKWISWGENCKFLDFLKKKKKSEKKHFFFVSAHKRDFFQKTQKMTFSVQQIDKKWFKKKVSKGSSTWFFSKNGHFWTNAYVDDPKKNPKNEKCQKKFLQYQEILVENAFWGKRDQKNFFGEF